MFPQNEPENRQTAENSQNSYGKGDTGRRNTPESAAESDLKGCVIRFRYGDRFGLGNAPQGIIVKSAAFVPGVHDSVIYTEHLLICAAAAMAAISAGGFYLIAKQHKGSPLAHYTPDFAPLP